MYPPTSKLLPSPHSAVDSIADFGRLPFHSLFGTSGHLLPILQPGFERLSILSNPGLFRRSWQWRETTPFRCRACVETTHRSFPGKRHYLFFRLSTLQLQRSRKVQSDILPSSVPKIWWVKSARKHMKRPSNAHVFLNLTEHVPYEAAYMQSPQSKW